MNKRVLALLLVGLLAASAVVARAEDADADEAFDEDGDYEDDAASLEEEDADVGAAAAAAAAAAPVRRSSDHPLTNLPPAHPDVKFVYRIADVEEGKLPLGEAVDAVVGLVNDGSQELTVLSMGGSLNSPFDFGFYIQNFTLIGYNTTVPGSGGESAFMYRFGVSPQLEPVDYQVALTMFYTIGDNLYSTTFLNATQTFYTTTSEFDLQTVFSTVSGILVATAVLYFLYTATDKRPRPAARPAVVRTSENVPEDWMAGYTGPGGRKAGKGKGKGKKD